MDQHRPTRLLRIGEMASFQFFETLGGTCYLDREVGARRMALALKARSGSMASFVRQPAVELEGEIDIVGFADNRYLRGTLGLEGFTCGAIQYALSFTANDNQPYSFLGKKILRWRSTYGALTVVPGVLFDHNRLRIGAALLRFDIRLAARFVRSFRLL
jgi:hypothetical protein